MCVQCSISPLCTCLLHLQQQYKFVYSAINAFVESSQALQLVVSSAASPFFQMLCLPHCTQGDNYGNLKFPFKSEEEPLYGNMGATGEQHTDEDVGDGDTEVRNTSYYVSDLIMSDYIPQEKAPPLPQKP